VEPVHGAEQAQIHGQPTVFSRRIGLGRHRHKPQPKRLGHGVEPRGQLVHLGQGHGHGLARQIDFPQRRLGLDELRQHRSQPGTHLDIELGLGDPDTQPRRLAIFRDDEHEQKRHRQQHADHKRGQGAGRKPLTQLGDIHDLLLHQAKHDHEMQSRRAAFEGFQRVFLNRHR